MIALVKMTTYNLIHMEKVQFLNNGQKITGSLLLPKHLKDKNPAVLFFHGMTSSEANYIPLAQRMAEKGIVGLTINLRGHGDSEGSFDELTIHDGMKDGIKAYDTLVKYPFVDKERVGICGASFGAGIAALVSGKRKAKSLVLRVPATYSDEMMEMTYEKIMELEQEKFNNMIHMDKTPPLRSLEQFKGALLVVTSENDTIIPPLMSQQFIESAKNAKLKKLIEIKGATHNLTDDVWREQFRNSAIEWFGKTL